MTLAIIIPVILALYYSYTYDFQPQGRYYLPMVVPFMYFPVMGIEKIIDVVEWGIGKTLRVFSKEKDITKSSDTIENITKERTVSTLAGAFLYHLLYAFLAASLLYATFISMLGYYSANGLSLF